MDTAGGSHLSGFPLTPSIICLGSEITMAVAKQGGNPKHNED